MMLESSTRQQNDEEEDYVTSITTTTAVTTILSTAAARATTTRCMLNGTTPTSSTYYDVGVDASSLLPIQKGTSSGPIGNSAPTQGNRTTYGDTINSTNTNGTTTTESKTTITHTANDPTIIRTDDDADDDDGDERMKNTCSRTPSDKDHKPPKKKKKKTIRPKKKQKKPFGDKLSTTTSTTIPSSSSLVEQERSRNGGSVNSSTGNRMPLRNKETMIVTNGTEEDWNNDDTFDEFPPRPNGPSSSSGTTTTTTTAASTATAALESDDEDGSSSRSNINRASSNTTTTAATTSSAASRRKTRTTMTSTAPTTPTRTTNNNGSSPNTPRRVMQCSTTAASTTILGHGTTTTYPIPPPSSPPVVCRSRAHYNDVPAPATAATATTTTITATCPSSYSLPSSPISVIVEYLASLSPTTTTTHTDARKKRITKLASPVSSMTRRATSSFSSKNVVMSLRIMIVASSLAFMVLIGISVSSLQDVDGAQRQLADHIDCPYDTTTSTTLDTNYDATQFKSKLRKWRKQLQEQREEQQGLPNYIQSSQKASYFVQKYHVDHDEQQQQKQQRPQQELIVPFWNEQNDKFFSTKRRHDWELVVVILVEDCIPDYYQEDLDDDKIENILYTSPTNVTETSTIPNYIPSRPRSRRRTSIKTANNNNNNNNNKNKYSAYPTLTTLHDALQTEYASLVVYFPQLPQSTLFPTITERSRLKQQACQAKLQRIISRTYQSQLENGQLQVINGVINTLPSRIKYDYNHRLYVTMRNYNLLATHLTEQQKEKVGNKTVALFGEEEEVGISLRQLVSQQQQMQIQTLLQYQQLQLELEYSLGIDFAYISELGYQHGDLLLFLRSGTKFVTSTVKNVENDMEDADDTTNTTATTRTTESPPQIGPPTTPIRRKYKDDYGLQIIQHYENFHSFSDFDSLQHRLCYMSFVKEDGDKELIDEYEHYLLEVERNRKIELIKQEEEAMANLTTAQQRRQQRRQRKKKKKEPPPVPPMPPKNQHTIGLPTGIMMEKYQLYRWSLVIRTFLPYNKNTTSELMTKYCEEWLWETRIVQPRNRTDYIRTYNVAEQDVDPEEFKVKYPPALFTIATETEDDVTGGSNQPSFLVGGGSTTTGSSSSSGSGATIVDPELEYRMLRRRKQQESLSQQHRDSTATTSVVAQVPPWVTVDPTQLGPQPPRRRTPLSTPIMDETTTTESTSNSTNTTTDIMEPQRRLVTFVVPTSSRPHGIKNSYVTASLNQLFPLIRKDFVHPVTRQFQATVLIVICGNTQEEIDDHEIGLWEYYGPEIKEGIVEIVSTNVDTYPSLHNVPKNYNDEETRIRWRSKQNLDISACFYAARGRSDYIVLLEDDTGYRPRFTSLLKETVVKDQQMEQELIPTNISGFKPIIPHPAMVDENDDNSVIKDDYYEHIFGQIHFGFGYTGVMIHDDDALTYAVMHYLLMDERPCDMLFLWDYIQGKPVEHPLRYNRKKGLLTHMGKLSSLPGKEQAVWG